MHAHKFLLVVSMAGVMAVSADLRADDTPEEAALRALLRKACSESDTQTMSPAADAAQPSVAQPETTSSPTATTTVSGSTASVSPKSPETTADFAPIQSPALPISATKEQRLNALLIQYQADQITPEQYHTQRAAILAGQ